MKLRGRPATVLVIVVCGASALLTGCGTTPPAPQASACANPTYPHQVTVRRDWAAVITVCATKAGTLGGSDPVWVENTSTSDYVTITGAGASNTVGPAETDTTVVSAVVAVDWSTTVAEAALAETQKVIAAKLGAAAPGYTDAMACADDVGDAVSAVKVNPAFDQLVASAITTGAGCRTLINDFHDDAGAAEASASLPSEIAGVVQTLADEVLPLFEAAPPVVEQLVG